MKKVFLLISVIGIFSCSNEKNKHVFHYLITGSSTKASDLYGIMGPGIKFDSPVIDIPFEVTHDVYYVGKALDYELRIADTDTSHKYLIKIFIDDKLMDQATYYDANTTPPSVCVKGQFVQ